MKELLSGNEAIARGAYECGVRLASAYPGTPSTEILENMVQYEPIISEWAPNEKVALDVAVGGAYAGVRSMAVMKHVGLNVAADSFFYAAMTGAEAGLVIVSADDPAMHSSQNEQDNRRYAKFARVPCLEPSDSQEAKEMVAAAFEISERFDTPVLLRITTRIAHSHTLVALGERPGRRRYWRAAGLPHRPGEICDGARQRPQAPSRHRGAHRAVEPVWRGLLFQPRRDGRPRPGHRHPRDRLPIRPRSLPGGVLFAPGDDLSAAGEMVRDFAEGVARLVVIEELDPFLEEEIRLMGIPVEGKSIFPMIGELSPGVVRRAAVDAGLLPASEAVPSSEVGDVPPLPMRPPLLCPGCPHRGVFSVTNKLKLVINGDIGCYTLGFLPPLSALHTCGCMGASIGVAHGANRAGTQQKNVAVLGDSTFFHTGMPALLNVAYNRSDTVTIILDNRTTAMTGQQENPATGRTLAGEETLAVDFEALARSMGIGSVATVDSYDLDAVEAALREALDVDGPAVVVAKRACALLPEARERWLPLEVDSEQCNGCGLCFRIGCPAILRSEQVHPKTGRHLAEIDPLLCTGCEVCAQVCFRDAIFSREEMIEKQEASA